MIEYAKHAKKVFMVITDEITKLVSVSVDFACTRDDIKLAKRSERY